MAQPGNICVDEDFPGEPLTNYGKSKRAAENAVLEAGAKYGMHVVNLRLAIVYSRGGRGNLERMVRAIQSGWFPPLPEMGNQRSLVHVQDVVEVMRTVAKMPKANGHTYIISDPCASSGRQIYKHIRAALGFPMSPTLTVPASLMLAVGWINSRLGEVVDRLIRSECYSPVRIEFDLGWRARVDFSEGLREMVSKTNNSR